MLTDFNDDKKGPKYEVGQQIKTYDINEQKVIDGVVTEVGDETITVQWGDLLEDTEYEICEISLAGDFLYKQRSEYEMYKAHYESLQAKHQNK